MLFVASITLAEQLEDKESAKFTVLVNERDPLSIKVGEYYVKKRGIPAKQLQSVSFDPKQSEIRPRDFIGAKTIIDLSIPDTTQFLVLTWTKPFRVGCMSITSAFALGYSESYCSKHTCSPTAASHYFNSDSTNPFDDFDMRPTMMLAYKDYSNAKKLIDRGIAATDTNPMGTAYLVSTNDVARNVRAISYENIRDKFISIFNIEIVHSNHLKNKDDVLFYFTGLKKVPSINTNAYLPGAIADHLTSTGGVVFGSQQMSVIKWLEAGATASYGTVTEPCNFPQKFPNPEIVMGRYFAGETLIEAYWKSVAWPGEGLFVGEPLARPFTPK